MTQANITIHILFNFMLVAIIRVKCAKSYVFVQFVIWPVFTLHFHTDATIVTQTKTERITETVSITETGKLSVDSFLSNTWYSLVWYSIHFTNIVLHNTLEIAWSNLLDIWEHVYTRFYSSFWLHTWPSMHSNVYHTNRKTYRFYRKRWFYSWSSSRERLTCFCLSVEDCRHYTRSTIGISYLRYRCRNNNGMLNLCQQNKKFKKEQLDVTAWYE